MLPSKEDITELLIESGFKKIALGLTDKIIDFCREIKAPIEILRETSKYLMSLSMQQDDFTDGLFSKWKDRIKVQKGDQDVQEAIKIQDKKKAVLEEHWSKMKDEKSSEKIYTGWNGGLPKKNGADNKTGGWDLQAKPSLTLESYQFLFQTTSKKLKYRKQLKEKIAALIKKDYKLHIVPDFSEETKEERIIIGEIGNEEEDALSDNCIILLNRDRDESGREAVHIEIDEAIKEYSLFEGEIVGLRGIMEQKSFIAKEILKPLPLVKPPPSKGDQAKYFWGDGKYLSVIIAAGPFTQANNIDYLALRNLLKVVEAQEPHLLILAGPFVDEKHKIIESGDLKIEEETMQYIDLFNLLIGEIQKVAESTNTRVVIQPSVRDVHHPFPFPQPSFNLAHKNIFPISNPQRIKINGLSMEVMNAEILNDIDVVMFSKPNTTDPDFNLVKSMLEQRSLYPVFPPYSPDFPVEFKYEKHFSLESVPDILVIPSTKPCFAKDYKKEILMINPGMLSRESSLGTYCALTIFSNSEKIPGEVEGVIELAGKKIRADIVKL